MTSKSPENVMTLMWEFNTYLAMCGQERSFREMVKNVAQHRLGVTDRNKEYRDMVNYYVQGRLGSHYPYRWRATDPAELSDREPYDKGGHDLKKGVLQLRNIVECTRYTPGGGPGAFAYLSDMLVWKVCSKRVSLFCNPIGKPRIQISKENCEYLASAHLRMLFKDMYHEDRVALFEDCSGCSSTELFDCLYWCCVFKKNGKRRISEKVVTNKILFILKEMELDDKFKLRWHLFTHYKQYLKGLNKARFQDFLKG